MSSRSWQSVSNSLLIIDWSINSLKYIKWDDKLNLSQCSSPSNLHGNLPKSCKWKNARGVKWLVKINEVIFPDTSGY